GAFDSQSTDLVSASLIGYSVIIILSPIGGLISNTLISIKDIKFVNWLAVVFIGLNAFFDWVLLKPFGHTGIAYSSSVISVLSVIFYYLWLKKRYAITFFNLKKFLFISTINLGLYLIVFILKSVLSEIYFLLIGNIAFLVLFVYLNREIIRRIFLLKNESKLNR
nr:lipid II flippase MurJ [Thermotogota bacterium]